MIVTVTANPSIDRTIELSGPLQPGSVQRANADRVEAGGKGINVSRALRAAQIDTVAVFPAAVDDPFLTLVARTGVAHVAVPLAHAVRTNLALVDPAGTTTKVNLAGAAFDTDAIDALRARVVTASEGARWLTLAGSLPPGAGDDLLVDLIDAVRAAHGPAAPRIAVDTSGAPLRAVIARGAPDLIKPNGEELADLLDEPVGDDPDDVEAAADRARRLVPERAGAALVTLGARGALLVDAEGILFGPAPHISVLSTVGAGDSSLAGYLIAQVRGDDRADRLRHAIGYGAAAAALPGTGIPTPSDVEGYDVTITDHRSAAAATDH